jgi:hypothetical protein
MATPRKLTTEDRVLLTERIQGVAAAGSGSDQEILDSFDRSANVAQRIGQWCESAISFVIPLAAPTTKGQS